MSGVEQEQRKGRGKGEKFSRLRRVKHLRGPSPGQASVSVSLKPSGISISEGKTAREEELATSDGPILIMA